jgi:hypothetical protein
LFQTIVNRRDGSVDEETQQKSFQFLVMSIPHEYFSSAQFP